MNIPIIQLLQKTPDRKHYHYIKVSVDSRKFVNTAPRGVPAHVPQRSLEQLRLNRFHVNNKALK